MIKAYAKTIQGLEEISIKEIKELLNISSKILYPGMLTFETKTLEDIAKLTYHSQSLLKTGVLLQTGKFKELKDIVKEIKSTKLDWKYETFAIKSTRQGKHNFSSKEIEHEIGSIIKGKVNLENPHTLFAIEIQDNNYLFGIDFAGFPLDKRFYRVKMSFSALNSIVAYAMIRLSDYKNILLDPYCRDGIILIEADYFNSKLFIHQKKLAYENFLKLKIENPPKANSRIIGFAENIGSLKNSKINISMADAKVELAKREVEWIETMFKDNELEAVVSFPPYICKRNKKPEVLNFYNQLSEALRNTLKNKGKLVINTPNPDLKIPDFKQVKKLNYQIGDLKSFIYVFEK
ncbi:hypothetical protein J4403_03025 [Candidatus Woesearchaeota archaeon]|nr:hypothetical protein [Candidatus Woesearchaeota archaeon]